MPPSGLEVLWEQKEFPLLLVLCVGDLNLRPLGKCSDFPYRTCSMPLK